jgi:hypothetical protein
MEDSMGAQLIMMMKAIENSFMLMLHSFMYDLRGN